jgi:hypothetical protein
MTITPIAIFQGADAYASTLETLAAEDWTVAFQESDIRSKISTGDPFIEEDGDTPPRIIIPLNHRDAPNHAAEALHLDQMNDLLAMFCEHRGLAFKSADELLSEVAGADHELAAHETVNWLSAFVDAYFDHEGYLRP